MSDEKEWLTAMLVQDASELLRRYGLLVDEFEDSHNGRSKLFVDLLMAYECILKAIITHFDSEMDVRKLHKRLRVYGHNVVKMKDMLPAEVPNSLKLRHPKELSDAFLKKCLRVDLRYAIESYWFREANEEEYYATVSSYRWITEFARLIDDLICWSRNSVLAEPKIVSGSSLTLEELLKTSYNPYFQQDGIE